MKFFALARCFCGWRLRATATNKQKPRWPQEHDNLIDRLKDAAKVCHGKGAGRELQIFERLQGEYEEMTGETISEIEARNQ